MIVAGRENVVWGGRVLNLYPRLLPHEPLMREVIARSKAHGFSCREFFRRMPAKSPASTPYAACKIADSVFIPSPQRVLKLRRWSLGLRRWMRGRTRQGEPGEEGI